MNDEIKEILDSWKLGIEKGIDKNGIYVGGLCYSWEQLSLLLDYITNLQQIEQDHKETNATLMSELAKLEEENERLKQPQIFIDTQDMEERYGEELYKDYLKEQLEDYKSRCEKAVKYIDTNFCIENRRDLKEVVNILQNERNKGR